MSIFSAPLSLPSQILHWVFCPLLEADCLSLPFSFILHLPSVTEAVRQTRSTKTSVWLWPLAWCDVAWEFTRTPRSHLCLPFIWHPVLVSVETWSTSRPDFIVALCMQECSFQFHLSALLKRDCHLTGHCKVTYRVGGVRTWRPQWHLPKHSTFCFTAPPSVLKVYSLLKPLIRSLCKRHISTTP